MAAFVIPIKSEQGWILEKYSKIKSNEVQFLTQGVLVKVTESASPLIFNLGAKREIIGFRIKGEFRGLPHFVDLSKQGKKGFDDYALRLGFVVSGEKKLSGLSKVFAPDWVKQLYAQAPEGAGIDHIHFYNYSQNKDQLGQTRVHPLSDLIQEDFVGYIQKSGPFDYEYKFKNPMSVLAIWLSIDGDDTKSAFEVLISNIEIF